MRLLTALQESLIIHFSPLETGSAAQELLNKRQLTGITHDEEQ